MGPRHRIGYSKASFMPQHYFGIIGIDRGSLKLEVAIAGLVSCLALLMMIRDGFRAKTHAMPPLAIVSMLPAFLVSLIGPFTEQAYLFPPTLDAFAMFLLPVALMSIIFWQCLHWGKSHSHLIEDHVDSFHILLWAQFTVFLTGFWNYVVYQQDYFVNEMEPLAVLIGSVGFLSSVYTRRDIRAQSVAAGWIFGLGNFLMYAPMVAGNMSDPYPQADHGYYFPYWIFSVTLIVNVAYPIVLRRRQRREAQAVPARA